MQVYSISGNITQFGHVLAKLQNEETTAESEEKAINNILYRWKKKHGYKPTAPIKVTNISIRMI